MIDLMIVASAFTGANIGRPFAILLDGVVLETPVIRSAITGGEGQITGGFTTESARALAQSIQTYTEDLPLKFIEHEPSRRPGAIGAER